MQEQQIIESIVRPSFIEINRVLGRWEFLEKRTSSDDINSLMYSFFSKIIKAKLGWRFVSILKNKVSLEPIIKGGRLVKVDVTYFGYIYGSNDKLVQDIALAIKRYSPYEEELNSFKPDIDGVYLKPEPQDPFKLDPINHEKINSITF